MDNILRGTWIENASRKRKFDSTVIVMASNGSVYGFPYTFNSYYGDSVRRF